ncbi:hypothetical protein IWQ62_001422 [Dispira parvispora]|uniref:Uncharacterized protein n=1 Tax=Dispira parvispora TaxID=1520584 RepID=A0A9W8AZ14_9FUNG|nr:hypothetical protein IWQ62_001422 [Dispira parvispora]
MVSLTGWYLYRDHAKHRCTRVVRTRVQEFSKRLQDVRHQANGIFEKGLSTILPWFTTTNETSPAESLHQNRKKVENTLGYVSELLLRTLEDMDGLPLRSVLDSIDLSHSTSGAPVGYQPLPIQTEALHRLKERRRALARHINRQLAEVDEYTRQFRSLVPPES